MKHAEVAPVLYLREPAVPRALALFTRINAPLARAGMVLSVARDPSASPATSAAGPGGGSR